MYAEVEKLTPNLKEGRNWTADWEMPLGTRKPHHTSQRLGLGPDWAVNIVNPTLGTLLALHRQ